jgi:hypothetical protein
MASANAARSVLSSRRWQTIGLVAYALVLSLFAWWPMLAAHPKTQTGDGPFFHKMLEAIRVSISRYRELPLWNPYECGGVPLWDNPQGIAAAPISWLTPYVGTTRTLEIWYILHSAVGVISAFVFARKDAKLSRASSLAAASVWTFCGAFSYHLSGGHTVWVPFLYAPLALHLWRAAEERPRAAIGLGVLVALMMHEGGIYSLPHTAILLFLETVTRLWPPQRILRIAYASVIVLVSAGLSGASRFLPVMSQLGRHTRHLGDADAMQWETLQIVFLARFHARPVPGQQYVWGEYSGYFGPIVLTLALVGLFFAGRKRAWLVAVLVVELVFMMGHQGKLAPWHILNGHLYPFTEMRVPSRFIVMVTLLLCICAGFAIDGAPRVLGRIKRLQHIAPGTIRAGMLALMFVAVGDVITTFDVELGQTISGNPQTPNVVPSRRLYIGGDDLAYFFDQPQQNRGRLDCWEEWGWYVGAPLWVGDLPQAKSAPGAPVVVDNVRRTQNTFTFDANATEPGRVLLNSAYDRGWRTNVGTVVEVNKQLAVDLPAGTNAVRVRYWPERLTLGFAMLGVFLAGLVWFFYFGGEAILTRFVPPLPKVTTSSDSSGEPDG